MEALLGGKPVASRAVQVAVAAVAPLRFDVRGELVVRTSVSGAEVIVDGRNLGPAPASVRVDAGKHPVVVSAPGWSRWTKTAEVGPTGRVELVAELVPVPVAAEEGSSPWLWVGLGTAVAAGAAVAAFLLLGEEETTVRDAGTLAIKNP